MSVKDFVLLATLLLIAQAQNYNNKPVMSKYSAQCCDYKTITVFGTGQIQANPDQAIIQASISRNGATVAQAINNLSEAVNNITSILNSSGLTTDDYYTTSFNVYPNTSYVNNTSVVVGQIAYESFQITVPFAQTNGSIIGQLIDSLASIDGITISGLTFDISNKTTVYQLAREAAFADAQQKALDYTQALSLTLGDLVSLVDSFGSAPAVTPSQNRFMEKGPSTPTQINVGAITITYYLEVIFGFK